MSYSADGTALVRRRRAPAWWRRWQLSPAWRLVLSLVVLVPVVALPSVVTRLWLDTAFDASGRRLAFLDEFTGTALDATKWTTCYWWGPDGCTNAGNNELQWYDASGVSVRDGTLRLQARKAPAGSTFKYRSGMVTSGRAGPDDGTPPRFSFTYGSVEVRAKMPAGQGLWSAIWMLPASHESRPEIDLVEVLGQNPNQFHTYLHLNTQGRDEDFGRAHSGATAAGWRRYGLEWTPDALVWKVDGVEVWRFTDRDRIPHEPMYLVMNLAVGGDWPGAPDAATRFPNAAEVDYAKIWVNS